MMERQSTEANSASSPAASSLIATDPRDGRQLFQLPNGKRLVLSPHRQAKKLIRATEGLSPRQYRKRRKELMRASKQTNVAADAG
jgi:hypothetical protein